MSVMDLAGFPTMLDARYTELLEQELAETTDVIPSIYNVRQGDRLEERSTTVGELDSWPEFTGGPISQQGLTEGYETTSRPREYATMTVVTRRLIDDDFFGVFTDGMRFRPMVRAGIVTRQEHATRLFEMIDVVDTHFSVRSDGLPIASASHTYRTAGAPTWSNTTAATLTPVALRAAIIAGRKIPNDQNKRSGIVYDEIFLCVDLVPVYNEIANTPRGFTDTTDTNVPGLVENQESRLRSGIRDVIALPYWTSTTGWVLSNSRLRRENVKWIERVDPEYGRITEFDTLQVKSRGYMRYGTHIQAPHWAYAGGT